MSPFKTVLQSVVKSEAQHLYLEDAQGKAHVMSSKARVT